MTTYVSASEGTLRVFFSQFFFFTEIKTIRVAIAKLGSGVTYCVTRSTTQRIVFRHRRREKSPSSRITRWEVPRDLRGFFFLLRSVLLFLLLFLSSSIPSVLPCTVLDFGFVSSCPPGPSPELRQRNSRRHTLFRHSQSYVASMWCTHVTN